MTLEAINTKHLVDAVNLNSVEKDKLYALLEELGLRQFIVYVDGTYINRSRNLTRKFFLKEGPAPAAALTMKDVQSMAVAQRVAKLLDSGELTKIAEKQQAARKVRAPRKRKAPVAKPVEPVVEVSDKEES